MGVGVPVPLGAEILLLSVVSHNQSWPNESIELTGVDVPTNEPTVVLTYYTM